MQSSSSKACSESVTSTRGVRRTAPAARLLQKDCALSDACALLPQTALCQYALVICSVELIGSEAEALEDSITGSLSSEMPKKLACAVGICSKCRELSEP